MRPSLVATFFCLASASACIAPPAQLIGGTVTGLSGNAVLANNGGDSLNISSNGNFVFATRATSYDVTVTTQPAGQLCTVSAGQGTPQYDPITSVLITCATDPNAVQNGNGDGSANGDTFYVGGVVEGLSGTVILKQGTDFVTVTAPQNTFQFPADLLNNTHYSVEVTQQPFNQTCTLTSSSGTISAANVGNLNLSCVAALRTISFNVQGSAGPVTVLNNGADPVSSTVDGSYTFPTALPDGAKFNVTVYNEPTGQACIIDNGYGILQGTSISGINVSCQNPVTNYTISGTAQGITGPVVLNNAGIENITVSASGVFTFPSALTAGSTYNVSVVSQPTGQSCAITTVNGGTITQSGSGQAYTNINNLQLNCAAAFSVGGTVTGLASGQKIRLVDNSDTTDVVSVTANGSYTFTKKLVNQAAYSVAVMTEPSSQSCVVSSNASGIVNNAAVTAANITCTTASVNQYTVGGTIVGLNGNITLTNAGVESATFTANGNTTFAFPTAMANAAPYRISISAAPSNRFCSIAAATGTVSSRNVTSVAVTCVAGGTISVPVSGLNGTMSIANSAGVTAVVTSNGVTTMPGVFDLNAYITLTPTTAPSHQRCVVVKGSGTLSSGTLNPVITCGPFYAFVDGQNANVVLGQPNFLSRTCSLTSAVNATTICNPYGDAYLSPTNELFVADSTNNRVLGLAGLPAGNGSSANLVLGQSGFTSYNAQAASTGLSQPSAISGNSNHLIVADTNNNRVVVYVPQPTSNHPAASVVVGQSGFTTNTKACTATGLNAPQGAIVVAGKLIVADTDNNRVLIYNTIPTSNNQAADLVLGQPNMTTCLSNIGTPQATTLTNPTDVWSDGTNLLIADSYNNRVLLFPSFPTGNGQAASIVLGQQDLVSNVAAVGNAGLTTPTGVTSNGMQVFVADSGNNRIVVWGALPTIIGNGYNGQTFDHVLGQRHQDEAYCNDIGNIVAPSTLCTPSNVSINASHLVVTDTSNSRYVIYEGF